MSFRVEEKLLINKYQITEFKSFLSEKKANKPYPPRIIKSLYFENSKDEMYRDSIEGSTPRKKIRIRNYPNSQNSFFYLETKISSAEGRYKTSKNIDKKAYDEILNIGIYDYQYGVCSPKIYVTYKREYYKINDVRISIDEEIKYSLFTGREIGYDNNSIVELKSSFSKDRDNLINDFPFQRTRFSKYCNGFEKI